MYIHLYTKLESSRWRLSRLVRLKISRRKVQNQCALESASRSHNLSLFMLIPAENVKFCHLSTHSDSLHSSRPRACLLRNTSMRASSRPGGRAHPRCCDSDRRYVIDTGALSAKSIADVTAHTQLHKASHVREHPSFAPFPALFLRGWAPNWL
jgi:hypothetical protein